MDVQLPLRMLFVAIFKIIMGFGKEFGDQKALSFAIYCDIPSVLSYSEPLEHFL